MVSKTYVKPQKHKKKNINLQLIPLERKNADLVNYVCPYVKL